MSELFSAGTLGADYALEALYRTIRSSDGARIDDVALGRETTVEALLHEIAPLLRLGVARVDDGVLHVAPLRQAIGAALEHQAAEVSEQMRRLLRFAGAMRHLDEPARAPDGGTRLDAEVINGPAPVDLMVEWITESSGELMFLRPDQWRFPSEPVIAAAFKVALDQGRRARGIYPVRALHQARSVLTDRASAGEEIRLLPEVPSRLAIVGEARALVPQHPGVANERAVVLRDEGLVSTLKLYFEELWDQAVALPAAQAQDVRHDARRLLLQELAVGARDEQIARTLGIGLRTVRRRIAALTLELGAESRFQAGVEAARRGWV